MTQSTSLPRLLKAEDLSAQLGLPLWRVYQLAREGALPHVRIGRSLRFDPAEVAAWLKNGGTPTHAGGIR